MRLIKTGSLCICPDHLDKPTEADRAINLTSAGLRISLGMPLGAAIRIGAAALRTILLAPLLPRPFSPGRIGAYNVGTRAFRPRRTLFARTVSPWTLIPVRTPTRPLRTWSRTTTATTIPISATGIAATTAIIRTTWILKLRRCPTCGQNRQTNRLLLLEDLLAHQAFDIAQVRRFIRGTKGNSATSRTCPARPANPMHVGFGDIW